METKQMTKSDFEKMLNEKYGVDTQMGWNRASGAKTRPYGTWLRNADRAKFNWIYSEYLKEGE